MEDETDELLLAEDESFDVDPEQLPHRVLTDFAVYNTEAGPAQLDLSSAHVLPAAAPSTPMHAPQIPLC